MERKCPKCNSSEVIPIVYGLPTANMAEEERRGEIKLGGCLDSPKNPEWHCKRCGNEWK